MKEIQTTCQNGTISYGPAAQSPNMRGLEPAPKDYDDFVVTWNRLAREGHLIEDLDDERHYLENFLKYNATTFIHGDTTTDETVQTIKMGNWQTVSGLAVEIKTNHNTGAVLGWKFVDRECLYADDGTFTESKGNILTANRSDELLNFQEQWSILTIDEPNAKIHAGNVKLLLAANDFGTVCIGVVDVNRWHHRQENQHWWRPNETRQASRHLHR